MPDKDKSARTPAICLRQNPIESIETLFPGIDKKNA
jgi:hypothetical protein